MTTTTAPDSTTTSTLSDWAGPYVTNMLAKGQAVSEQPYAVYDGALTAGPSALQTQAFSGIAGLTLPSGTYNPTTFNGSYAANDFSGAGGYTGTNFNGAGYTPGTFNSTLYTPGDFSSTTYAPTTFSSRLPGTSASDPYGVGSTESYMNPYLAGVLTPQLAEARRQSEISRMNNAARLTGQGALGGSRQAILESEGERNLAQLLGELTGKGYSDAFTKAQDQQFRTAELGLNAQKASEGSKQFGATMGMDAAKQAEMAKQFAATYGLDSQKAAELAKQFGATFSLDKLKEMEKSGQFGANLKLNAAKEAELSRQFGANFGLNAQKASEESKQFGANYGLKAGELGIAGLQAQLAAGNTQQGIDQAGLTADYNEFVRQRDFPMDMVKFQQSLLTGLPISTVSNNANGQSGFQEGIGSLADIASFINALGLGGE